MFLTPLQLKERLLKEFKSEDRIMVLINNPIPPYDDGYCVDTVRGFLNNYEDLTENPDKRYDIVVGKQVI